jgi:pimeloyl-ACP methyl ester carboxylesterase
MRRFLKFSRVLNLSFIFSFCFGLFFCLISQANTLPFDPFDPFDIRKPLIPRDIQTREHFTIHKDPEGHDTDFIMHGLRYRRDGAQPVILAHGFLNTYWITEALGRMLYHAGFDVWMFNHVGFGLTGERSTVVNYKPGMYGFRGLLQGMDLVIQHVHHTTGQKVNYISFSMGGQTYNLYISGTTGFDLDGNPVRSPHLSQKRSQRINKSVTIGDPLYNMTSVATLPKTLGLIGNTLLNKTLRNVHGFVPLGLGGKAFDQSTSVVGAALDITKYFNLVPFLNAPELLLGHIGETSNFGIWQHHFAELFATMFANPHTDILRDFAKMLKQKLEEPRITYNDVENLVLVGEKDALADPEYLLNRAIAHLKLGEKIKIVVASGAGHLDLMMNKVLVDMQVGQQIITFLQDSEMYHSNYGVFSVAGDTNSATLKMQTHFQKSIPEISAAYAERGEIFVPGGEQSPTPADEPVAILNKAHTTLHLLDAALQAQKRLILKNDLKCKDLFPGN